MAIVLDGTLAIQRDEQQKIVNIIWFLYGLPETDVQPEQAVFLHESFGQGSPQMISFELDGEEYAVYADWEAASEHRNAVEVKEFYRTYGYVLISALKMNGNLASNDERVEWLLPVQYFSDYVTMINELSRAG
ncbi:hypothetical protein [Marinobacter sp. HL-58]|uniref:hypothetical protein n=1 Tax=Marinobacter sp. HL-58 TaxID=1479237 RepID=UPI00048A08B6|nr:hypothetical protein [Marinobacter sp. HL-58]KPP97799.1 MAG: hypothetical protein HLUCCO03_09325 [Marinobacter sp. HL-58]